ncbi:hypothetical protein Mgra_00007214 [Meloidogyne graminicola]|uniref:EGF-like domain-containing protein n=1 Tax=Meloidogyne graminicola TaxID=189291 RepID=A0A8S9ZJI5_9BILA|nr:hypothetical protein Mgra_00007214 [Meloidogyne graminicola]
MFILLIFSTKSLQQQQNNKLIIKCLDNFDINLKRQCMKGEWKEKFYFEKNIKKCTLFCLFYNQHFEEKLKSTEIINKIFNSDEENLKLKNNKFLLNLQNKNNNENLIKNKKLQKQQFLPLLPNLCESSLTNPCKNNGTCLWNENTGKYFCKCTNEYFNENCSKKIDFNPCNQMPWSKWGNLTLNKILVKNGGICRTTRSSTLFFCSCSPSWGALPPIEEK